MQEFEEKKKQFT